MKANTAMFAAIGLIMAFAPSGLPQATTQSSKLAAPYADPKNFFKISPPAGWRIQEYPSDPRGKVAFIAPVSRTDLRVLAKAVDIPDHEALIRDLKNTEKRVGVQMNIEPMVFKRLPAIKRTATISMQGSTLKMLWIDLLIDGVSHNLQYAAPPTVFDKHYETAWQSMLTYEPIRREKPASREEALKHDAAKWFRLAKIAADMGKTQVAKDCVAEGLEVDPKNSQLLQLKKTLDQK